MSLVDSKNGEKVMEESAPNGVNVHRQVQAPGWRKHARNLPENALRGVGVVDDVVDDDQIARPVLHRKVLSTSRYVGRPGIAQLNQAGLLGIERLEGIDRIPLGPVEKVDDTDRAAPDFKNAPAGRRRSRRFGEMLLEPYGPPPVPVQLTGYACLDAATQPLPEATFVLLRLLPPCVFDPNLLCNG